MPSSRGDNHAEVEFPPPVEDSQPGSTAATREIAEADDKLFELPYASESHPTEPFCENAEDTPKPTTRSASLLSLSLVLSPTLSLSMRLCSLSTFLSL
eukprot:c18928_g1_i3 orf=29-322(-)